MNEKFSNLSERLNHALLLTDTKKADLARAIGVKPQVIQFLCNSQTRSSRFTFEIAIALGLNIEWLTTGEGPIFLADDPVRQFSKVYAPIPLLPDKELRNVCLHGKKLEEVKADTYLPLKTDNLSIFAVRMFDSSMEPAIPPNADIFILPENRKDKGYLKFVFVYLNKFATFAVRQVTKEGNSVWLVPKNTELFKEIKFDNDVTMLGIVTACSWSVGS